MNCVDAEFLKRLPISKADAGVNERNLDEVMKRVLLLFGQVRTKVRDGHVPAGEDAAFGAGCENLTACGVRNDHFVRRFSAALVLRTNDSAVKSDTGSVCRVVETIVRNWRCNYVFGGPTRDSFGNKFANEQPRDGRIAVWKMKTR